MTDRHEAIIQAANEYRAEALKYEGMAEGLRRRRAKRLTSADDMAIGEARHRLSTQRRRLEGATTALTRACQLPD